MKTYQGQQLYRLQLIGGALEEMDRHRVIDWKKYRAAAGDNRANFVFSAFLSFIEREKFENKKPEERTELDIALDGE